MDEENASSLNIAKQIIPSSTSMDNTCDSSSTDADLESSTPSQSVIPGTETDRIVTHKKVKLKRSHILKKLVSSTPPPPSSTDPPKPAVVKSIPVPEASTSSKPPVNTQLKTSNDATDACVSSTSWKTPVDSTLYGELKDDPIEHMSAVIIHKKVKLKRNNLIKIFQSISQPTVSNDARDPFYTSQRATPETVKKEEVLPKEVRSVASERSVEPKKDNLVSSDANVIVHNMKTICSEKITEAPNTDLTLSNPEPEPTTNLNPEPESTTNLNAELEPTTNMKPEPEPTTNLNAEPEAITNLNAEPEPPTNLNPEPSVDLVEEQIKEDTEQPKNIYSEDTAVFEENFTSKKDESPKIQETDTCDDLLELELAAPELVLQQLSDSVQPVMDVADLDLDHSLLDEKDMTLAMESEEALLAELEEPAQSPNDLTNTDIKTPEHHSIPDSTLEPESQTSADTTEMKLQLSDSDTEEQTLCEDTLITDKSERRFSFEAIGESRKIESKIEPCDVQIDSNEEVIEEPQPEISIAKFEFFQSDFQEKSIPLLPVDSAKDNVRCVEKTDILERSSLIQAEFETLPADNQSVNEPSSNKEIKECVLEEIDDEAIPEEFEPLKSDIDELELDEPSESNSETPVVEKTLLKELCDPMILIAPPDVIESSITSLEVADVIASNVTALEVADESIIHLSTTENFDCKSSEVVNTVVVAEGETCSTPTKADAFLELTDTDSINAIIDSELNSTHPGTNYVVVDLKLNEKHKLESSTDTTEEQSVWKEITAGGSENSQENLDVIVEKIHEVLTEEKPETFKDKPEEILAPIVEELMGSVTVKMQDSFDDIEEMMQEDIADESFEKLEDISSDLLATSPVPIVDETPDKLQNDFDDIVESIPVVTNEENFVKSEINTEDIESIDVKEIENFVMGKNDSESVKSSLDKCEDSIIAEIDSYFVEHKTLEQMDAELTKIASDLTSDTRVDDTPTPDLDPSVLETSHNEHPTTLERSEEQVSNILEEAEIIEAARNVINEEQNKVLVETAEDIKLIAIERIPEVISIEPPVKSMQPTLEKSEISKENKFSDVLPSILTVTVDENFTTSKGMKSSPTVPKIRIKPIVKPSENKVTPCIETRNSPASKSVDVEIIEKSEQVDVIPKLSIKALKKSLNMPPKEDKINVTPSGSGKSKQGLKLGVTRKSAELLKNVDAAISISEKEKATKVSSTKDFDKISIYPTPPKITIKPVKSPEPVATIPIKHEGTPFSKVTIKSFKKSDDNTPSTSGEISKKGATMSKGYTNHNYSKITIKPVVKPNYGAGQSEVTSSVSPKATKRALLNESKKNFDHPSKLMQQLESPFSSPAAARSPKSERILLKINKDNESMKSQLITERNKTIDGRFEPNQFDKLEKITLKLSKEGGHPEIMQSTSFMKPVEGGSAALKRMLAYDTTIEPIKLPPKRMKPETTIRKSDVVFNSPDLSINIVKPESAFSKKKEHQISDDITIVRMGPEKPTSSGLQLIPPRPPPQDTSVESKLKEILLKLSRKKPASVVPERADSNSSDDVKIVEVTNPPMPQTFDLSIDDSNSQDVMIIDEIIVPEVVPPPPAPKKRGRPRKIPLVVRPDLKEEDPVLVVEPRLPELSLSEPRSKRACVERKPYTPRTRRGRGSRGGARGTPRGSSPRGGSSRGGSPRGGSPRGGSPRGSTTRGGTPRAGRRGRVGRPRGSGISRADIIPLPLLAIPDCEVKVALNDTIEAMIDKSENETIIIKKVDVIPEKKTVPEVIEAKPSESVFVEEDTRMSADEDTSISIIAVTTEESVQTKPIQGIDIADESRSSTNTVESNRNKRGRLEISEIDSHVKGPEQIAEYSWGNLGPYMLQEQVAQYLGVKSFKRKYPGLNRHAVDMQERDYLRENGLASEALCDMGLTAVPSSEILDIMFADFQDKYEEYRKYQREKQAKDVTNKQKALSLATNAGKEKGDCVKNAVRSAASWNETLNRTRTEQRRCYMDLQTFTVMYPRGRRLPPVSPAPGSYPVALVPGQFSDYYKSFTPSELNYLPLNSVIYGPVMPNKMVIPEVGQSDGSCSDSDSSSGSDSDSSDSSDSSADEAEVASTPNQPTPANDSCKLCTTNPPNSSKQAKVTKPEQLIYCAQCNCGVHPGCIDLTTDMLPHIRAYKWQCTDCKTCWQCREPSDDDKMLFCDRCDRGYHIYCVGLRKVPLGRWHCQQCTSSS